MFGAVIAAGLLAIAAEEPELKSSLELETPEEAWRESGFRVGLGYAFDEVFGAEGVPGGAHHSAVLRLGVRLDEQWSLLGTFRYGVRFSEFGGMRFAATLEPTLHLTHAWTVALGAGIGGFIIGDTGEPLPRVQIVATYTLPATTPLVSACEGAGLIAVARSEYAIFVSPLFSMGPAIQVDAQWTPCIDQLNVADIDTGEAINFKQYWRNYGLSVAWLFWWR